MATAKGSTMNKKRPITAGEAMVQPQTVSPPRLASMLRPMLSFIKIHFLLTTKNTKSTKKKLR
jgi:hypothetical protein